jgi:hypothetical protein
MSYSPYAHTTATSARLGLIKLGAGVSAAADGGLVTTSVPSITQAQVTTALGFTPYSNANPNGYITGITSGTVTTVLGFTPYSNANPNGYITGITSGTVTTALGYTPYSNANPSGYITGITSGNVTSALGYTPYSSANPSNFISAVPNASTQVSSLGVGTPASGTSGEIRATNNITGYYTSDRSLKENIRNIESALSKVKSINGVMFDWKQDYIDSRGGEDGYFVRKQDTGVIAQEVESILPEVVGTREDGTKAVAYEKFAGLLIEAIKELDVKVEDIKRHLGI